MVRQRLAPRREQTRDRKEKTKARWPQKGTKSHEKEDMFCAFVL
jgi:hypothetical protein